MTFRTGGATWSRTSVARHLPARVRRACRSASTCSTEALPWTTVRDTVAVKLFQQAGELDDGHYLLRSNLSDKEPEWLWQLYMLLVRIEGVFRCSKNDLGLRPIYHQTDTRVEAHILVSFLVYCLWVTLQEQLRPLAPGLKPRQALDQLAGIQMLDLVLPTSDGQKLTLSRYTQPDAATTLLLQRLGKELPEQPPPRLSSPAKMDLPPGAV